MTASNYNVIVLDLAGRKSRKQNVEKNKGPYWEPVVRKPPAGAKWVLSDAWKEIIQRREQERTEW